MREKKMVAKIDIWEEREKYCLCRLPVELLLIILSYLSVIDSLSFRSVCKCWRSAFLKCPVPIPQSEAQRRLPWFVLLRIQDFPGKLFENERPLLYTTGKLGDLSAQRIFTPDIPELCGTQFLLSKHGWLLLFSTKGSSLFFLNPFSRTRIDLPFKDISKACSPVFDISAPPTSSECMVFVISCADEINFEISTCCRGESAWTTKVYGSRMLGSCLRPVRAVFVEGIWYCLHEAGYFSAFDAVKCNWKDLALPKNMRSLSADSPVSYVMKHGEQVHLNVHDAIGYEVVLKEPLEAIRRRECNVFWLGDFEFMFRTCLKGAILQMQDQLQVDSFNAHAWCGTCDSEDKWMEFHWHHFRSFVDNWYPLKGKRCPRDNCYMVAWLEPQLIHCSPNLDWSSHT